MDMEDLLCPVEIDFDGGFLSNFGFAQHLAARSAGGDGFLREFSSRLRCDGEYADGRFRINGVGGKDGDAFGTESTWVGDVLLIVALDDLPVV